jgi:hypothetical protein
LTQAGEPNTIFNNTKVEKKFVSIGNFGPTDRAKIMNLVNSGVDVLREVATLREGLKDSVSAVSEELEIDKKVLNLAIRTAYKMSQQNQDTLNDMQTQLDTLEELLKAAGVS